MINTEHVRKMSKIPNFAQFSEAKRMMCSCWIGVFIDITTFTNRKYLDLHPALLFTVTCLKAMLFHKILSLTGILHYKLYLTLVFLYFWICSSTQLHLYRMALKEQSNDESKQNLVLTRFFKNNFHINVCSLSPAVSAILEEMCFIQTVYICSLSDTGPRFSNQFFDQVYKTLFFLILHFIWGGVWQSVLGDATSE